MSTVIPVVPQVPLMEAITVAPIKRSKGKYGMVLGNEELLTRLGRGGTSYIPDYATRKTTHIEFTPDTDALPRILDRRVLAYGYPVKSTIFIEVGDVVVFGEHTIDIHTQEQFQRRFQQV